MQHWQYDPTHYRYLISAVYKGHRSILSFYAACLTHAASTCDLDFFKTGDLSFPKERNTLPKKSKSCHLTFSAFGFSVYLTWPDRSGEEKN